MVGSETRRARSPARLRLIRSLKLLKGRSLKGFVLRPILQKLHLTPTQIQTRTIVLSELSRQERKRSLKSCSQAVSPRKRMTMSRFINQPLRAQPTRGPQETTASVTAMPPSAPDLSTFCQIPHTKRAILADLDVGEEIAVMVGWSRSPEPVDPPETAARAENDPHTTPLPGRQPLRVSNSNRPQGQVSLPDRKRASSALSAAPGRLLIRAGARGETRGRRVPAAGGRPGIENKPSNSPPKRRSYPLRQNPRPKVQL